MKPVPSLTENLIAYDNKRLEERERNKRLEERNERLKEAIKKLQIFQ